MEQQSTFKSVVGLRAWKLALAGPSVYWYFPIFFALLSTKTNASPIGLFALIIVLMVSASWGFLLNDLFDREADSKSGRADVIHGHGLSKSTMWVLILGTAIISWIIVFLIGGGYIFKVVLAFNYLVAILYSTPPIKLKIKKFWGFFANSLMERPLPIVVFLTYLGYYNIWTIVLPVLMELTWSVFKHQTADIKDDIHSNVTTFAVYLGEKLSNKIVFTFLNPLSALILLFLTMLSWYYIPSLMVPLIACFFILLVGVGAAYTLEKQGKVTVYVTPTDPPYIIFLNLAYRFLLLPILAYGILVYYFEYYPVVALLAIIIAYHLRGYSKLASKMSRMR